MKREREDDDLYDDDDKPLVSKPGRKANVAPICPYVGTVNRERLDFDFEKVCSVSLAANNVYACLGMNPTKSSDSIGCFCSHLCSVR